MTKLQPNTLEGLRWGLKNFDAIETDIRLSKDGDLVIHHDPVTADGKIIAEMTLAELKSDGLFLFNEFLNDPEIRSKVKSGKSLWIELKPNCSGKKSIRKQIAEKLYSQLLRELDETKFGTDNINILSFARDLLDPLAREDLFPCYPILPNINE
ncbi:MAG: glycerophosphodiester phosphodiesterase, partial [Candidatus Heimdallarchaeota archaeon]